MRIFAAFQHFNWEGHNLAPALRELGDLTWYDWHPPYDQYDPGWHYGLKGAMNQELLHLKALGSDEHHDELDILALALVDVLTRNGWLRGGES